MSHGIDQTVKPEGDAYFADEAPWHRLGKTVEGARTSAEVKKLALDWNVTKEPLWTQGAEMLDTDDEGNGRVVRDRIKVKGHFGIVRSDSDQVLGVVGARYRPVQNSECFSFMDELVGSGDVKYESAGSLKGGRVVWLLARLDGESAEVVDGDKQVPFVLLVNSHDGSTPVRIMPCYVRTVCWNTLSLATRDSARRGIPQFSIRHTGDVKRRVDDARQALGIVRKGFEEYVETARQLAAASITADDYSEYLQELFPQGFGEKASRQARSAVAQMRANFTDDPKQNLDGMDGTAWAAVNAVSQYLDHERPTRGGDDDGRDESRLHGSWLGTAADLKARAFTAARDLLLA